MLRLFLSFNISKNRKFILFTFDDCYTVLAFIVTPPPISHKYRGNPLQSMLTVAN